jgi:Immunity protein Imm5
MAGDGVPPDLERRIEEARAVLDDQPDGSLPLPQRRRIREAFGPWRPTDRREPPPGLRRRVELARLAAEHVLPIWHAEAPDNHGPERMLELARQRLEREVSEDEAEELSDRFHAEAERLASRKEISQRALAAGDAARVVVPEVDIGDYDEPPDADDEDLDPDNWEAAYVASVAAAGYPDDDPEARRAFWRWYLDEAVPAAWAAG